MDLVEVAVVDLAGYSVNTRYLIACTSALSSAHSTFAKLLAAMTAKKAFPSLTTSAREPPYLPPKLLAPRCWRTNVAAGDEDAPR